MYLELINIEQISATSKFPLFQYFNPTLTLNSGLSKSLIFKDQGQIS